MKKLLVLLILLVLFLKEDLSLARVALPHSIAPINPAFVEYIKKVRSGEISLMTQDGYYLGYLPSPLDPTPINIRKPTFQLPRTFPTRYDLREENRLTRVRNQRGYGTCWAHATYGSLESCELTATGIAWNFSENNLINWVADNYNPIAAGLPRGWYGGNYEVAVAYLVGWFGPAAEDDDPYPNPGKWVPKPVRRHIQEVYFLPGRTGPLDNDLVKFAVMQYGAVATVMRYDDFYFNSLKNAYYSYKGSSYPRGEWHAVCIVGWDDNYPKENFKTQPPGNGAFIARNSWGDFWGENGYFYVSYYDAYIGMGSEDNVVFVAGEDPTNYTKIYQYDPFGPGTYLMYGSPGTAWFKNVFTATGNENIKAAGFYTPVANSTYSLYVYINDKRVAEKSGTIPVAGYHTITLDNPVPVMAGQQFSIAVSLKTPGYDCPIAVEWPIIYHSTANRGESFVSSDGQSWVDITDIYSDINVCLKAYTVYDDALPPTAPSNLKAKAVSSSDIELSWEASTDEGGSGLAGYSIERRTSNESFSEIAKVDANTTNYKDSGLTANTTYEYRVRAYDNAGNYSKYSNTISADVTPPAIKILSPDPPQSSQEVIKVSSVVLLSAKVQDPILDPTKVQFLIDNTLSFTPIQSNDEFLCVAKNLSQGSHSLKVVAEDTCGNKAEQSVNFQVIGTPSLPSANIVFLSLPFKPLASNLQNIIIYDKSAYWSVNKYILSGDPNFPIDLTCKGFWVKLAQAFDPTNVKPLGASIPTGQELALPLSKGWQAIGLPWTYPLPISGLQVEDKNGNRFSFSQASNLVGKVLSAGMGRNMSMLGFNRVWRIPSILGSAIGLELRMTASSFSPRSLGQCKRRELPTLMASVCR